MKRVSWLLILHAVAAWSACSQTRQQQPSTATVILQTASRAIRVEADVVRTPEEREKGLMYRKELAAYRGMLFIFEREEQQSFWMKNTYIPLDMIFINEAKQVAGIVENAEPMTTVSRSIDVPSRYVLEVNAGFAKRHEVSRGTQVRFEGLSP